MRNCNSAEGIAHRAERKSLTAGGMLKRKNCHCERFSAYGRRRSNLFEFKRLFRQKASRNDNRGIFGVGWNLKKFFVAVLFSLQNSETHFQKEYLPCDVFQ